MVYFGGANTDATTVDALKELQRVSGVAILLTQGSYSKSVSASAGTHDGGGVVDVNVAGWNYTVIWDVLTAARSMGLIAWYRTPSQGFAYHIHVVRRDCGDLSPAARAQVVQYLNGQNGLAGHGADDGPSGYRDVTWASYSGNSSYRPPLNTDPQDAPPPQQNASPKDWFDMATPAEIREAIKGGVTDAIRGEGVAGAADRTKNGVGENTQAIHELDGGNMLLAMKETNILLTRLLDAINAKS
jgi:hypothetical protein